MTTQAEARKFLFSMLPPGIEKLYDLTEGGDPYKYFDAGAELILNYGFALLDKLRLETFPTTIVDKLPDWEKFLGISRYLTARFGAIPARQQAVIAKIRAKGAFIDTRVQAVLAPLLGYFPNTVLQVLRADRATLRFLHTYTTGPNTTAIAPSQESIFTLPILDGGLVSAAGTRLLVEIGAGTGPFVGSVTLRSPAPDFVVQTYGLSDPDGTSIHAFYGLEFAGKQITGDWIVQVVNQGTTSLPVLCSLFVEGIARDQETGGAVWHWGVYVDPAHFAESGFSDIEAAEDMANRLQHSHAFGTLVTSLEPWPGVSSGTHSAIPGRCIPSAAT